MNIKNNTKNYLNDSSNFRSSTNGNGRRKLSSDVLDKSVISPFYTEKPSFSFWIKELYKRALFSLQCF